MQTTVCQNQSLSMCQCCRRYLFLELALRVWPVGQNVCMRHREECPRSSMYQRTSPMRAYLCYKVALFFSLFRHHESGVRRSVLTAHRSLKRERMNSKPGKSKRNAVTADLSVLYQTLERKEEAPTAIFVPGDYKFI